MLSRDRDPETREPTVEIAHDALLGAWERLRGWIAAAEEDLRTQHRLARAARDWAEAGRDPSFLLHGARLERLVAWREEAGLALTPVERGLLEESLGAPTEPREGARRERGLERRSMRRLRTAVGVLAGGVIVAGAVTAFALNQRAEAEDQERTAVARGLAAAAVGSLGEDAERSVLLALEAVRHTRNAGGAVLPEAQEALHRAVVASRIRLRVPGLGGMTDWSPDGDLFVTEGPEDRGLIDIRDAATGRSVRTFHGHDVDVNFVAFSADGSRLATSGDDGTAKVWDPRTGRQLASVGDGPDQVWGAALSPDGTRLAAAWWEAGGGAGLRRGRRDGEVCEITGLDASLNTAFSPDGRRLAIATLERGRCPRRRRLLPPCRDARGAERRHRRRLQPRRPADRDHELGRERADLGRAHLAARASRSPGIATRSSPRTGARTRAGWPPAHATARPGCGRSAARRCASC